LVLEAAIRMAADPTAQVYDRLRQIVNSLIGCLLQLQQQQMKQRDSAELSTGAATATTPSTSTGRQQQQQQQQGVIWSPGLLVTCVKALSQCVERRMSTPLLVLKSVLSVASLCPGLTALVDLTELPALVKKTELPVDGKPSEQMLTAVMWQTWLESDSRHQHASGRRRSSSSNGGSSIGAEGVPLVLLIGRTLHVAARALLQLHEQAGGAAATGRVNS
jgi:hypothetical protein